MTNTADSTCCAKAKWEGVSGWSQGERVLVDPVFTDTETGRLWMIGDTRRGAYAEFVVVEQTQLLSLPDEVSAVDGSCLPVPMAPPIG